MILKDQVAIVTGGGRGIGEAIAKLFAKEGAAVTVSARSADEIERVAREIEAAGGRALAVPCDVARRDEVEAMVAATVRAFGTVDILVNNASILVKPASIVAVRDEDWQRSFDINVTGTFLCSRAVFPILREKGRGRIINISSLAGLAGAGGRYAYRATKAAVINFTESLALEGKPLGICVNSICPGLVDTSMMRDNFPEVPEERLMPPEAVAQSALFLAGPTGDYYWGEQMRIGGGLLVWE